MNIKEFYNELKEELEDSEKAGFYIITPSNNKEKLDNEFEKFNAQSQEQKEKADNRSMTLYGMTNYDHYHVLLSKLKKGNKDNEDDDLKYDKDEKTIVKEDFNILKDFDCSSIKELEEKIKTSKEFTRHTTGNVIIYPTQDSNELESLYLKYMALDINNRASSDNKAQELFGKTNREIYTLIKDNIIKTKNNEKEDTYSVDNEEIEKKKESLFTNDLPIFTPKELVEKVSENFSITESNDILNKWLQEYILLGYGIKTEDYNMINLERINILRKAIYENDEETIIRCGWISGVEFNSENRVKASKIVREKMEVLSDIDDYNLIEESSTSNNKKAISIVLISGNSTIGKVIKKIQDTQFSHVSIALDDDLSKIYSYNMRNGFNGLAYESFKNYIKEGVDRVGVYTFLVTDKVYKSLENTLDKFNLYINKTKYSILNLLTIPLNIPLEMDMKLVCSEFVDTLLKAVNLDITKKKSSLVSPRDFINSTKNNANIVEIFNDHPNKFNASIIEKKIKKLKRSNHPVLEFTEYSEDFINEAKSLPVQFDSDGNLILKNIRKINFEQEYANSHRLLKEYDKTNSYEPMKFELSKMQFFITLLEKKIYKQGKDKSIKELKVRARFLNDFKKYLKIITTNDPNFNFTKYYEQSPFNDALIKIDKDTLKFGWNALKYIIK